MAYGFMIESEIAATNVEAYNKDVVATIDVDGGNLVALTPPDTQGDNVWKAAAPSADSLGNCWMAYNPSMHISEVGNGQFAGLNADPRAYTNLQNYTFTVFKPKLFDEVILSIDCVDTTGTSAVAGDVLESKADQTLLTRVAAATGATEGSTAFVIEHVYNIPFPATKGSIGITQQKAFKVYCVQE